jgi:2-oxoisovalerate dehydrogenase E1 component
MKMKLSKIPCKCNLQKIEADKSSYASLDIVTLANMALSVFLIREFETTLLKLSADGCIHGPVHTSIGEEACAAGTMMVLRQKDKIVSTHRAHHHYLAKIISYYASASGFDVFQHSMPTVVQEDITTLLKEIMGLASGCCGGRGGSMHLRNAKIGVIGTNAIVAGGVPLAAGAAFASKYTSQDDVTVCFLGDGAVNQGAFHEAVNLASIWKLPIVYFIENNHYAVATSIKNSTATENLAAKACAYNMPGLIVDGMDTIAVHDAVNDAVNYVRGDNGPIIIEAKCYRYFHHAGPIAGSNFGYRSKDEEAQWQQQDPYRAFAQNLIKHNILTQQQIEFLQEKAKSSVMTAVTDCCVQSGEKYIVKENLLPTTASLITGLRSNGDEFTGITYKEKEDFTNFEQKKYVEAIASVTARHLERDAKVFVIGEEIANFGGGPYGATKGLPAKYPRRVLNTPISESGFVGLAGGAAMSGLKPIVEIMFPDFALVAADQLFNQLGKLRHIYGNSTDMPVVVRTRIAIGCGYGGQHSMDPVGLFGLFSGWQVVAPSNSFDYIGLFNTAMRSLDPVLIIEHHELYPVKSDVPKEDMDYFIPFGKARVVRTGKDITLLAYSSAVNLCKQVCDALSMYGIDIELIDLRSVSPADIDYTTIGSSLKKTGKLVIVEQAAASMAIGYRIIAECQKQFFDFLTQPAVVIAGADVPLPVSKRLETAAVPSVEHVSSTIKELLKR